MITTTRDAKRRPLLVIVGPTGVGKTALSLKIASEVGGEIVSADSRLFYRGMDIGTAKPSVGEMNKIPHHLIDICQPDETITLGTYQRLAYETIDKIYRTKRTPMLVGGTGQYIWAVVQGWAIPAVAPNTKLRELLEKLGQKEIGRWIDSLDPTSAAKIDPRNVRRRIRALEVTLITGQRMSDIQSKSQPLFNTMILGLTIEREKLYQFVDERVDRMVSVGLLDEVERLRNAGYGQHLSSMSGLGYRQLLAHLDGETSFVEAIERIKFETHRFIRQQYTWFRRDDPSICWYDVSADDWETKAIDVVKSWLSQANGG